MSSGRHPGRSRPICSSTTGARHPTHRRIPATLPGSGSPTGADLYFTTASSGPGAVSFRALAKPLVGNSGVIVVAVPLTDLDGTLRQLLLIELVVSAVVLLGLGIVSWVMVRRDLRPLVEITETAGAIARGDLSQRVPRLAEGTEVGQLGEAFNTMIDEIEVAFQERAASEDRLRRFLADASHELRTPLTSILGYAELFDLGVRDRPEDLAVPFTHIKDEAARMQHPGRRPPPARPARPRTTASDRNPSTSPTWSCVRSAGVGASAPDRSVGRRRRWPRGGRR